MARKRKSKMRLLCFHPKDAKAFSDVLRERWPTIGFYKRNYWDYQKDPAYKNGRWKNPPEFSSLCETDDYKVQVWVRPEGWQPEWSKTRNEYGIYVITNEPKLEFTYDQSFMWNELGRIATTENTATHIGEGRVYCAYDKDDKEHERFLNAVWRMVAKLTTNIVDVLDSETGEVRYPSQRTATWFGYHALDWCRKDPKRRLKSNIRPAE